MTARRGDMIVSVLTAALGKLPLAVILIGGTLRMFRLEGPAHFPENLTSLFVRFRGRPPPSVDKRATSHQTDG